MRLHILFALPLLAGPLAAQQRAIAPAPSPLFARPVAVADLGVPHQGISVGAARVIGGLTGLLVGIGFAQVVESQSPSGGDDGGLGRGISYGLIGLVVGAMFAPLVLSE